jgi:hypothetical protein
MWSEPYEEKKGLETQLRRVREKFQPPCHLLRQIHVRHWTFLGVPEEDLLYFIGIDVQAV